MISGWQNWKGKRYTDDIYTHIYIYLYIYIYIYISIWSTTMYRISQTQYVYVGPWRMVVYQATNAVTSMLHQKNVHHEMHNLYRQRVCIRCGCTFRWGDVLRLPSLSACLSLCSYDEPTIAATWHETSHLFSSACDKNAVCWVHLQAYSLDKVSKKGMWPCCRQTDIAAPPCVSKGAHIDSFEGMHMQLIRRVGKSKLKTGHCFLVTVCLCSIG